MKKEDSFWFITIFFGAIFYLASRESIRLAYSIYWLGVADALTAAILIIGVSLVVKKAVENYLGEFIKKIENKKNN